MPPHRKKTPLRPLPSPKRWHPCIAHHHPPLFRPLPPPRWHRAPPQDRLLTYNASLNAAFRRIDGDSTGYVSSAEIKNFFRDAYLGDVVNDRTIGAIIDMADLNGDDEIDYSELSAVIECDDILELAALVPDKKIVSQEKQKKSMLVGSRGVTAGELQYAATTIKEKLLMKNNSVRAALKQVDEDGSGYLSREEVLAFLNQYNLIKYTDFYTGEVRGELEEKAIHTLIDFVDKSGDGMVDYNEFTKVLICDDIMTMQPASASTSIFSYKSGAEAAHRPEGAWGSNAATGFASSL
jgi:Ca2+-binding EF-hand superfamily protein